LPATRPAGPYMVPASVRDASRAGAPPDASGPGREGRPPAAHASELRYVHELFDQQVSRQPDSAAVVLAGREMTYRQLFRSANRLAHHLQILGVAPETLVGVGLERGAETIRCLLAILKAGGAYMPLDPSLPAARLIQICAEARPTVILVNRAEASAFGETDARLLLIDEWAPEPAPPRAPARGGA